MDERLIQQADLDYIERNLRAIHDNIDVVESDIGNVNSNVKIIYDEVGKLASQFTYFIDTQKRANRLIEAKTNLIQIRQELDKKFGHYDNVRRTTTGILQATDLGIVRKETISTATEELMLETPNYWLTPCLVTLAAWINNQPELAERALNEAIRRNDEKTSLFFALVCRRADRKSSCLKWAERYLSLQNAEELNRNTVIILDAYASGLLGVDSDGIIYKKMNEWLEHLSNKEGFIDQQILQWSEAIKIRQKPIEDTSYEYLRKYSKTWPIMEEILEGAYLHSEIIDYFIGIFEQKVSTDILKKQLDDILTNLVTDFDDEELPLKKQEKFEQLVVEFEGDENRAKNNMNIEQTAFEASKDFTQLLTDAAMKPESSNASISTQKFSIALSKDWIMAAYNDITAQNRMKIPYEIEINIDTFNAKTINGENEKELINAFERQVESERNNALSRCELSSFDNFCLYGGGAIASVGVGMLLAMSFFLGIIAIIAGIGLIISHFSKKKNIEITRNNIIKQSKERETKGVEIIRATIAEVIDFREEFEVKDGESKFVIDFLDQISPDQYIRKSQEGSRRIKI